MNENGTDKRGVFLLILLAVFVALKTTGAVSWSWWWVTAPLWIPFAIYAGCVALLILYGIFAILLSLFL